MPSVSSGRLAEDGELARRYELVREELAETIQLNETLRAPSARAMEKLFAAIDAEEERAPRKGFQRSSETPEQAQQGLDLVAFSLFVDHAQGHLARFFGLE